MKKIILMIACCSYNVLQASQATKAQVGCPEEMKFSQEELLTATRKLLEIISRYYPLFEEQRLANAAELQNLLQQYPAIINATIVYDDIDKGSALTYAIDYGETDTARILIAAGANLDFQDNFGNTALVKSVIKRNRDTTRLLVAAGADTNIQNEQGYTALMFAARTGDKENIITLLNANANPYVIDKRGDNFFTILKRNCRRLIKDPQIKKALKKQD